MTRHNLRIEYRYDSLLPRYKLIVASFVFLQDAKIFPKIEIEFPNRAKFLSILFKGADCCSEESISQLKSKAQI